MAESTEPDSEDRTTEERASTGTLMRLVSAVELLASAHASRAREEAGKDLSRMLSGALLLLVAFFLLAPIVVLLDVAAALWAHEHYAWSLPASLGWVAATNAVLALLLVFVARGRLRSPVLVETRATLKRAALVLRGS